MSTPIETSTEINFFVVCFAGGKMNIISSHETKEQAYAEYGMKLSLSESRFVKALGYCKLYKK